MTDEHPPRPALPAATDMKTPAARMLSIAVCRLPAEQPSSGGHEYELPTTFGRLLGSGLAPFSSVGARKNWRHSMYVLGRPVPLSMLRQAIHFAPGASPIWLPAPSSPTAVPMTWVPWPKSSHGVFELKPQTLLPSPSRSAWIASHQLPSCAADVPFQPR